MAHGHHADPSQPTRTDASTGYAATAATAARPSGPCHCGEPEVPSTCCDTECFERPRYFCGHLLTDTDLSLEQRYVIGKQKLYHRTLHGHGIVCGLRLTCDPSCDGRVLVGEGFAIDDCGNDLIVCEPTPFDVVAALRDKQLLYTTPVADDCEPQPSASDCPPRQCFYVVACYAEQEQEYATPLTPACGPSPRACEPTRVRETVRFDVLDKLPTASDPLADLERRIQQCFTLFMEGPFAEALKEQRTQDALSGAATAADHEAHYNQIRKLRILFKRYLEHHPDHYNCTLGRDIDAIACPADPKSSSAYGRVESTPAAGGQGESNVAGQPGAPPVSNTTAGYVTRDYATDVRDAVCRLVDLAYSHVMGCVMGELAFSCPEPRRASCIVLGTVEIENGCIAQVCNCPRSYVWSFASFWQVAMAKLFGSLACTSTDETGPHAAYDPTINRADMTAAGVANRQSDYGCDKPLGRQPCCQDFSPKDGCEDYVRALKSGGDVASDVATALLDAIKWVRCSVQHAYAPTRTDAVLRRAMRGKPVADVVESLRKQDLQVMAPTEAPTNRVPWGLLDMLDLSAHVGRSEPLVVEMRGGLVTDIRKRPVLERVTTTESEMKAVRTQIESLQTELNEMKARFGSHDHPAPVPIEGPGVVKTGRRPRRNPRKGGPA